MPRECEGLHANLHSFFTIRSPLCLLMLRQLQRRASVLLAFSADARSLSPSMSHAFWEGNRGEEGCRSHRSRDAGSPAAAVVSDFADDLLPVSERERERDSLLQWQ